MKTIVMLCMYATGLGLVAFSFSSLYFVIRSGRLNKQYFEAKRLAKLAQNQEIK